MFGIDGSEFFVILLVLIVIVGPKDLPKMLKAMAKAIAYIRSTTNEFRHQFDDAMKQAELNSLQKTLSEIRDINPRKELTEILNPVHDAVEDMNNSFDVDITHHKLGKDKDTLGYDKNEAIDLRNSGRVSIISKRRENTL
ncbi:Sec-independent protein translocase protein TatB [Bartonella sp. CB175]|uniref:Sec-independent protein translocase protein TatB n=1 Tax=Bartonella sp. CB175 TaxID=3112256 RepID=UPI00300DC788